MAIAVLLGGIYTSGRMEIGALTAAGFAKLSARLGDGLNRVGDGDEELRLLSLRTRQRPSGFQIAPPANPNSAGHPTLFVTLPARQLPDNDYLLILECLEAKGDADPIGKKQFKIERR